jgi:nucleoside-diphosphate-sugar epimerase
VAVLVLGAGYIGAKLAELALERGDEVVLADNWYATRREQVAPLEERGAGVETADIRRREDVERLLALGPSTIYLLVAQASRPLSDREPDYTEATNATGVRLVGDLAARTRVPLVFASSLHVYGSGLAGEIGPELALRMHARRSGSALSILRLGIVYGPSPVEHDRPESQTVVDKFRRLAAAGEPLPLDDGGRASIGLVHVEDAARILLEAPPGTHNVAAETLTVADVAALAQGREPTADAACTYLSPFTYRHRVADYLRR